MRLRGATLLAVLVLALPVLTRAAPDAFRLTSPDFTENSFIPARFTCDGENTSPALAIAGVPAGTQSLVLIVDDPDAPSGTFTHWIVWDIPPGVAKILGGAPPAGSLQGTNDFGKTGYSGPCPPSGVHRYFFRLFALNGRLKLSAGASRKEIGDAIAGHVIGTASLMGKYGKGNSR